MASDIHPAAPHHLPAFITEPGSTDVLMVGTAIFLVIAVLAAGNFFLWLHSLPERIAHKSQKFQFELVAVLCLIALFTHIHLFWVIGLLLAFIDFPEIGKPMGRMAGALEKIAGIEPPVEAAVDGVHGAHDRRAQVSDDVVAQPLRNEVEAVSPPKERVHAGGRS